MAIRIPSDNENSNIIRIEGEPKGVQKAKEELMEMAHRMVCTDTRSVFMSLFIYSINIRQKYLAQNLYF